MFRHPPARLLTLPWGPTRVRAMLPTGLAVDPATEDDYAHELGVLRVAATAFEATARGATPVTGPALALELVAAGRSQNYRWRGTLDLIRLILEMDGEGPELPAVYRVIAHLVARAARVQADTVSAEVSRMRTTADILVPRLASLLRHPMVTAAVEGLRRRAGPPSMVRGAVPLPVAMYRRLRDATTREVQAAIVLMWCAAMRHADVAAMRAGGLWSDGDMLAVEIAVSKTHQVGLPRGITLAPPALECRILAPWTTAAPPLGRPLARPPLLPAATYPVVAAAIRQHAGGEYTPHSLRKGAVQHMLAHGARVQDIPLLTLHRSLAGLMAYANRADAGTRATVRELSDMLHR
jgi:integrase